jgi:hypothetical protein
MTGKLQYYTFRCHCRGKNVPLTLIECLDLIKGHAKSGLTVKGRDLKL